MNVERGRPSPEALLEEYGGRARLVVYLAASPGAGKTRRLLTEIRRLRQSRRDAVIGWIDLKGRPDLERLAEGIPRLPARRVIRNGMDFEEFDYEAALARKPQIVALDEIAHENLPGSVHPTRWEDALALRAAGITVLCACNVAHFESVAPAAERLTGHPLRVLVPDSFLEAADEVVALDVSPQLLQSRLRSGKLVAAGDIGTALDSAFSERTLASLRELMLRTVDNLTVPNVSSERASTAVAVVTPAMEIESYLERVAAVSAALDLALKIRITGAVDRTLLADSAARLGAEVLDEPGEFDIESTRAALVALPKGKAALRLTNRHSERDLLVIDPEQTFLMPSARGDLLERRPAYGRLTVYLGAAAGCGKTYAMLDRAQQLKADGIEVVCGFIETHGRSETAAMIDGLEVLPRCVTERDGVRYEEFDRDALIARKPQVALIDELAHTNAPTSVNRKRYEDVLAVLRAGIDVITTLNIQHLENLNDAVCRLTGTVVRETLPDAILALADEVILIDVSPQELRARLREGKIYPRERIDRALSNFFTIDNLKALRELALREASRAQRRERSVAPFERLLLCAGPRTEDAALIRRCSQVAARLGVRFSVAMITEPRDRVSGNLIETLHDEAARHNATWHRETTPDAPRRIIELARLEPETVIAVATTLRVPRWPQRNAFARRVLDAGARELLVLTRR